MHTISRFFTLLVILMMLVPSVIAAPNEKTNTKYLKITDLSKGTMKEIKDDKVKGLKSSSSDIVVDEKGKNHIKLKDSKPSKVPNEHKKVKVSIPKTELDKIDIDKDGIFGILRTDDDGVVLASYTATAAQLTDGIPMTFSEVVVNGFSGYREETFTGVVSGATLDITDVTTDAIITAEVTGTIPAHSHIDEENISTWPLSDPVVLYPLNGNGDDIAGGADGTPTLATYGADYIALNGVNSTFATTLDPLVHIGNNTNYTVFWDYYNYANNDKTIYAAGSIPRFYAQPTATNHYKIGYGNKTYEGSQTVYTGRQSVAVSIDAYNKAAKIYVNGTLLSTHSLVGSDMLLPASATGTKLAATFKKMDIYNYGVAKEVLTPAEIGAIYAQQYGVLFKVNDVSGVVAYDVASGAEKTLSANVTSTGIKYYDTSGATRNVTVRVYYTDDTTISTQSSDNSFHNISIVHVAGNTTTNGTIVRPIAPLYTGTAVLDSNNTNAVMVQNRTHYTIYTGALTAGSWAGYNVSVPNNADHGMWLDILMQWSAAIQGWIFGETAPTDYTKDISDELNVTVT